MVFKAKSKIVIINENFIDAPYISELEQIYGKEHTYIFQNVLEGAAFREQTKKKDTHNSECEYLFFTI